MPLPVDGAGDEIKDPAFSQKMESADGLVLVAPEYNHSFPGLLKHVLDTCLEEYIHKAAGIVGVSAGPFGGTRVVQSLLPVLREVGLTTTFTDLNFSNVGKAFDGEGRILDEATWARPDSQLPR
jgi:NAD(P)H-dependent FMN reductase